MTTDEGKDKRVDVGDALTESVRYSAKCNARCSRAARFLFDTGQRTKATRRVNFARFLFLLQFRARALFFSFSVPETRIDTDNEILIREVLQARELRVTRSTRFSTSDGRSSIVRRHYRRTQRRSHARPTSAPSQLISSPVKPLPLYCAQLRRRAAYPHYLSE